MVNQIANAADKHHYFKVISNLADDFDFIYYVTLTPDKDKDVNICFRLSDELKQAVPAIETETHFTKLLDLLIEHYIVEEDVSKFITATRRPVVFERLAHEPVYVVNFRARQNGKAVYCQMKFTSDIVDEKMTGLVVGIHNIDDEVSHVLAEKRVNDVINVLASEYNAVYYCNEDTHDYDILFQQGFVKEQLVQMRMLCPKYDDAFNFFVNKLVHPEDRQAMSRMLSSISERLKGSKSFKFEFRRLYDDRYLYTEAYIVKVGEADDELHSFVAGFEENDAAYRTKANQQKQLEYIISERTRELQQRNRTLNKINEGIIEMLGNITEARDAESGEHIRRVKGYTNILAKHIMEDWPEYGLTRDSVELMTSASALHDIGKISIPDAILLKPGRLTDAEFEIMKTHCKSGCEMLKLAPEDWSASYLKFSMDICHYHHERYDGNGYPDGLCGDEIPISAQIVAVADCFDALSSKRVYKEAVPLDTAFQMILDGKCGVFSPKILASLKKSREEMYVHATTTNSHISSNMSAGISTACLSWVKLLFVSDSEVNREIGRNILEGEGAEVTPAASGEEALRLFTASPAGHYDAILMDTSMPGINAIEAVKAIRSCKRADAQAVPVIGLTPLISTTDMNDLLAAGFSSCITKPIAIAVLNRVLFECINSPSEALSNAVRQADLEAAARIDIAINRTSTSQGLNAEYNFICYIDGNANNIQAFRGDNFFSSVLESIDSRLSPNRRLDRMFRTLIPQASFKKFREDSDRDRIAEYLRVKSSYTAFVPMIINGTEMLYRMKIVNDKEKVGCYILFLQSVDAEARAEIRSAQLIQILSESYAVVDYIDFEDDSFTRCQSDAANGALSGCFSREAEAYIANTVYPDDRAAMTAFFNCDSLRKQLCQRKSVAIRYRSVHSGKPKYFEAQFVNARYDRDGRYAILLLSDIDEIVRSENEHNRMLEEARKQLAMSELRANRDALTGVKNISAYTYAVSVLSDSLRNDPQKEFGVVMCDINELMLINDTYGHEVGDDYIRSCCTLICNSFKHSPVFRIGGDEFAVILTGTDYVNRAELMDELRKSSKHAERILDYNKGKIPFAMGMAVYSPEQDKGVADVIQRANLLMYENKRASKAGA